MHNLKFEGIPVCPYCNNLTKYVDSSVIYGRSYGMIYLCDECDAYVGCHKGTNVPLGTPAKEELRKLRLTCHAIFDRTWQSRTIKRGEAYALLQKLMGMDSNEAHIGRFTEEDCKRLIGMKHIIDKIIGL